MNDIIDKLLNQEKATRYQDWYDKYRDSYPDRDIAIIDNPVKKNY